MRTNIVIDDALLSEAFSCTGLPTKKAVIEEALRTLVRLKSQEQIRSLRGHLRWEGDLHAMREGRVAYEAHADELDTSAGDESDVDR